MSVRELVYHNRSYRRFNQEHHINLEILRELTDLARMSASAMNIQPLKYLLCCDPEKNALIFSTLGWAMQLRDWPGPDEGERPSAYIVILGDTRISKNYGVDPGIAAQSILLGAVEKGLGGCMIATIRKKDLAEALNIGDHLEILLVIALGKPREKVVIEAVGQDGKTAYWRDAEGTHHVPKRSLNEISIEI
jgi:nitroreductase